MMCPYRSRLFVAGILSWLLFLPVLKADGLADVAARCITHSGYRPGLAGHTSSAMVAPVATA